MLTKENCKGTYSDLQKKLALKSNQSQIKSNQSQIKSNQSQIKSKSNQIKWDQFPDTTGERGAKRGVKGWEKNKVNSKWMKR